MYDLCLSIFNSFPRLKVEEHTIVLNTDGEEEEIKAISVTDDNETVFFEFTRDGDILK